MLRISDEVHFQWNEDGTVIQLHHLMNQSQLELTSTDFQVLDSIVRLREASEKDVIADLVTRDADETLVIASVHRLLSHDMVQDEPQVARRDSLYMPMLYFRMFVDPLKTSAYIRALERRIKPGMRVLDVGAGLGIMSVAAAKLGAEVIALESRSIVASAKQLAADNNVSKQIEFVRGDLYDPAFAKDIGDVDLLVSEFIGDEIFDEEILLKTIWMRRLYLNNEAQDKLLPKALEGFAIPFESNVALNRYVAQSRQVNSIGEDYGLNVDAVRTLVEREGLRCDFSERLYTASFSEIGMDDLTLLGEPISFHNANLETADYALFKTRVRIPVTRSGRVDGVLLYFNSDLGAEVNLSSAPWQMRTHWPQIIYLRQGERRVTPGEELDLSVAYVGGRGFCLSIN